MESLDRAIEPQKSHYIEALPTPTGVPRIPPGYSTSPLLISQRQRQWDIFVDQVSNWIDDQDFWKQYTMVRKLGSGNFASSFEIVNKATKMPYVLKIFKGKPSSDTEYQILRQIRGLCPNHGFPGAQALLIVPDPKTQNPVYALMMDFVSGRPADQGTFTEAEVLEIGRQVLDQLSCLHRQGLVHSDIKPDNILVDRGPPLKATLIDYGAGCNQTEIFYNEFQNVPFCTACLGGHSYFWAPEINLNKKLFGPRPTPRSDIWALGISLWQILHKKDIRSASQSQTEAEIRAAPDSPVNSLIKSMIKRDPSKRPSADLLSRSIESSLDST